MPTRKGTRARSNLTPSRVCVSRCAFFSLAGLTHCDCLTTLEAGRCRPSDRAALAGRGRSRAGCGVAGRPGRPRARQPAEGWASLCATWRSTAPASSLPSQHGTALFCRRDPVGLIATSPCRSSRRARSLSSCGLCSYPATPGTTHSSPVRSKAVRTGRTPQPRRHQPAPLSVPAAWRRRVRAAWRPRRAAWTARMRSPAGAAA